MSSLTTRQILTPSSLPSQYMKKQLPAPLHPSTCTCTLKGGEGIATPPKSTKTVKDTPAAPPTTLVPLALGRHYCTNITKLSLKRSFRDESFKFKLNMAVWYKNICIVHSCTVARPCLICAGILLFSTTQWL
jgi:hypothetical protein